MRIKMSKSGNLRRSSRIKARVIEQNDISVLSDNDDPSIYDTFEIILNKKLGNIQKSVQRPTELFSDDDISGKRLYKFETPKRNAMTIKANQNRTPISRKVPKIILKKISTVTCNTKLSNASSKNTSRKVTPIKNKLSPEFILSESESISSSSNYVPSDDESREETSESGPNETSDEENVPTNAKVIKKNYTVQANLLSTPKRLGGKNKPAIIYKDFHMKTDEYFETQLEKAVTSDRTLDSLRNARLTKEKLEQLLANQNHVSTRHTTKISSMTGNYTSLFPMWYFIMEEGYTVLLHGLGSKRCLINAFHKSISDNPSLIVNGYFPSLAVKDILDGIIVDLLGLNCPINANECLSIIEKVLNDNPEDRLYLLIHNIDGIMLRSNKAQDLLSCLATIPNLCVLASVDHINAPLLWDHVKQSKYNFFWWDTTTFLPYQEETSYESSLLVQQRGALALSSLHNVFLSLTSNAKSIYIVLAKYQLSNNNNTNFMGMAFKDLYRAAREGFFVSSDLALRAQLTEFIDHKLVKTKRNIDGVEHLIIPLTNGLLNQFLEEHES